MTTSTQICVIINPRVSYNVAKSPHYITAAHVRRLEFPHSRPHCIIKIHLELSLIPTDESTENYLPRYIGRLILTGYLGVPFI